MTPTKELLTELNALRVAAGMKELKAWKESRAKLESALEAMRPSATSESADDEGTGAAPGEPAAADVPASSPQQETSAAVAPTVKRHPKSADTTRLTDIARANGKKEKVMRAKARRWQSKLRQYTVDPNIEDWTFKNEHLEAVCAILGVKVPQSDSVPT